MTLRNSRPVLAWRTLAATWRWTPGSACQICASWQRDAVCDECQRRFLRPCHRCRCCAAALAGLNEVCGRCILRPPAFDQTLAAVDYAYPWDGLVTRFKFGGACELARPLADLMSEALWTAAEQIGFEPPDVLLPVPLSAARQRERGYNQAWELARRIGPALEVPSHARWVERVLDTPHQTGLPRAERLHNLRGAFAVTPAGRAGLAGRRVAILDDVMTTGATLDALAATVRRAGATAVQSWVFARTVSDDAAP
ncbi:ComF family protein [Sphaerotilus sp.]|uniref:ComF family protein n=1 Tax=Sphaerotilus sp. TaxID=2093942 RepID=UPI0034E2252F